MRKARQAPVGSRVVWPGMEGAALGIDIGGSGIKGAVVDVTSGGLLGDRVRMATPSPATPAAVTDAVAEIVTRVGFAGPTGVAFPGSVRAGVARLAAHVDSSFLGVDLVDLFSRATAAGAAHVMNDADAAGVAEMRLGAGRGERGTVLLLTFGTGIGSALFLDGVLVPNTEFGHLEFKGKAAEADASAAARTRDGLGFADWSLRVNAYLSHLEMLLSPDLVIVGGGISRKWDEFGSRLVAGVPIRPAHFRNDAGIVGAALLAATG